MRGMKKDNNTSRGFIDTALKKTRSEGFFKKPGSVLHLDGDSDYLNMSLESYKKLNIKVQGMHVKENKQPEIMQDLLKKHLPDILVLTGHDSMAKDVEDYKDINNYRNSKYFVESVKKAREFNASLDDLVIFAGACQSNYEALIEAGANYASSPERVLIHALDPVLVGEKIACINIDKVISPAQIINHTITGKKGIGGLETRGKLRQGLPSSSYE